MDYFKDLGERVGRRWREADYNEVSFSQIAHEELERTPGHRVVDPDDILEWANQPTWQLPAQADIAADFANPPVTLYRGDRFYIDVNFWIDSSTHIHEHSFDGAFQVLSGSSLHTAYAFQEQRCYSAAVGVGTLHSTDCELLTPGMTRLIQAGKSFSHALFHIERPSSTIVVRTISNRLVGAQCAFYPPGLRVDSFFVHPPTKRNLQIAHLLIVTNSPRIQPWLERFFSYADLYATHAMIEQVFRSLSTRSDLSSEDVEQFLQPHLEGIARRSDWGPLVVDVFKYSRLLHDLVLARRIVHDPEHRFFLALLLNTATTQNLLALVQQRWPGESAAHKVAGWVAALCTASEDTASPLGLELSEPSQRALRYLLEGQTLDAVAARLGQDYGKRVTPEKVRQMMANLRGSVLSPLVQQLS